MSWLAARGRARGSATTDGEVETGRAGRTEAAVGEACDVAGAVFEVGAERVQRDVALERLRTPRSSSARARPAAMYTEGEGTHVLGPESLDLGALDETVLARAGAGDEEDDEGEGDADKGEALVQPPVAAYLRRIELVELRASREGQVSFGLREGRSSEASREGGENGELTKAPTVLPLRLLPRRSSSSSPSTVSRRPSAYSSRSSST